MATNFDNTIYTLANVMTSTTNDGMMLEIANTVTKDNELLEKLPFFASNKPFENLSARVTKVFEPSARVVNEGAVDGVNDKEQVIDTLIHYETFIEPDELALRGINDPAQWFVDEVEYTAQGFSNAFATQVITGDSQDDPGKTIDGLAKRYASLPASATDKTDRYYTVVSAGGSGSDNTSVYLVGLGKKGVHGIYLKNGMAGLQIKRLGPREVIAANGGKYRSYETAQMMWDVGLVSTNFRGAGRVANIDVSDLTVDESAGAKLSDEMIELQTKVRLLGLTPYWLVNDTIHQYFHQQASNKSNANVNWSPQDDRGLMKLIFGGIPMLKMDAISVAEATVS
jgi:hypothetical protein